MKGFAFASLLIFFNLNFAIAQIEIKNDTIVLHANKQNSKFTEVLEYPYKSIITINSKQFISPFLGTTSFKDSNFNGFVFSEKVNFGNCDFISKAKFSGSLFQQEAVFSTSHFDSANFMAGTFLGKVYFNKCFFQMYACFYRTEFHKKADFAVDTFKGKLNFEGASFNVLAAFQDAIFHDGVTFSDATFNCEATFYNVMFSGKADFSFLHCTDSSFFYFNFAHLPDTVDFSNIKNIKNEIDLSVACFKDSERYDFNKSSYRNEKRHWINFYKSDIAKFHLDYEHFRILLQDQNGTQLSPDESKTIYEGLLKNFKDRGQLDSYESLDIEYRDYKFGLAHWILHFWNCYGYHKEWVFYWAAGLLILFTTITFQKLELYNKHVYALTKVPNFPPLGSKIYIRQKRFYYSRIWYSFVYTATIFFLLSLKVENISFRNIKGVLYLFLLYATGIICLAYMANFVFQK